MHIGFRVDPANNKFSPLYFQLSSFSCILSSLSNFIIIGLTFPSAINIPQLIDGTFFQHNLYFSFGNMSTND